MNRCTITLFAVAALLLAGVAVGCDDAPDESAEAVEAEAQDEELEIEVEAAVEAEETASPDTQSVSLALDGMTCVNCAAAIEDAVGDTDGVGAVTVDFGERRADVDYDGEAIDTDDIIAAIVEAGFEAEPIEDSDSAE